MNEIILLIGVMLGIIFLLKKRNSLTLSIVIFQVLGIMLLTLDLLNPIIGVVCFSSSFLLSTVYLFRRKFKIEKLILLLWLFVIPIAFLWTYNIMNWPGVNFLKLIMIVLVSVYIYTVLKRRLFSNELSFLSIYFGYSLMNFIVVVDWLVNN